MGSLGCCLDRPARITSAKWNFLAASAACWAVGPLGQEIFLLGSTMTKICRLLEAAAKPLGSADPFDIMLLRH